MPTKKEREPLNFSPDELIAILEAADSTTLHRNLIKLMSFGDKKEQAIKFKLYEDFGRLRRDYLSLKEGLVSQEKFDAQRKDFTDKLAGQNNLGIHTAKELVKETLAAMDWKINEFVGRDLR